jgi:hypothetical protein
MSLNGLETTVAQRLKDKIAHRKFLNLQATRGERAAYLNAQQISLTMREAETIDAILDRVLRGVVGVAGTERTDPA